MGGKEVERMARNESGQKGVPAADATDLKILSLLREDARISIKHIAEKTFLSPPAVSARIEKLEKTAIFRDITPISIRRRSGLTSRPLLIWKWNPFRRRSFIPISDPA